MLGSFALGSTCDEVEPCGNGTCDEIHGESMNTCAADCQLLCGNGVCGMGERATDCAADCFCGDGLCRPNEGETPSNCTTDCANTLCGDSHCDWQYGENMFHCPGDCHSECCDCAAEKDTDMDEIYACHAHELRCGPSALPIPTLTAVAEASRQAIWMESPPRGGLRPRR